MVSFTDPRPYVLPFLRHFCLQGRQVAGKADKLAAEKIKKTNHQDHKTKQGQRGRQRPGKSLLLKFKGERMKQDGHQEGKKERNHQGFGEPHEKNNESNGKER